MQDLDFESYLFGKKIDSHTFKDTEPGQWSTFKNIFDQVHPESFTQQKLFLINKIRRRFPLKEKEAESTTSSKPKKPVI